MIAQYWGITPAQAETLELPESYGNGAKAVRLYRQITIDAPAKIVFRWLTQLKRAPYSYDWIDNLGRKSPETIDPECEALELGDVFMTIFKLRSFEQQRFIDIVVSSNWIPGIRSCGMLYLLTPVNETRTKLTGVIEVDFRSKLSEVLVGNPLAFGDLIMMRKQFLNLKRLSEVG